jgi:hypothetical protein
MTNNEVRTVLYGVGCVLAAVVAVECAYQLYRYAMGG